MHDELLFTVAEEYLDDEMFVVEEEEPSEDWLETSDPKHFIMFLTKEMNRFPKPQEVIGSINKIEQALGQWRRLDSYISKALREDYDGILDISYIDEVRGYVDNCIDQLEDMQNGIIHQKKRQKQMRKRKAEDESEMKKEAGTAKVNMVITPFQRAVTSLLMNGVISGGRNIEELWQKAKEKYELTPREELEIVQLLADMGYPVFKDRLMVGEQLDNPSKAEDGKGEWQNQYYS